MAPSMDKKEVEPTTMSSSEFATIKSELATMTSKLAKMTSKLENTNEEHVSYRHRRISNNNSTLSFLFH